MSLLAQESHNAKNPYRAISARIGWIVKPKAVIGEVTHGGHNFGCEKLYVVMVKFVTPVLLTLLLLQVLGLIKF